MFICLWVQVVDEIAGHRLGWLVFECLINEAAPIASFAPVGMKNPQALGGESALASHGRCGHIIAQGVGGGSVNEGKGAEQATDTLLVALLEGVE